MEHPPDFSAASIDRLIHALSGEALPAERAAVDRWLAAHSAHQAFADRLRGVRTAARHQADVSLPQETKDTWISAVQARIRGDDGRIPKQSNNRSTWMARKQIRANGTNFLRQSPIATGSAVAIAAGVLLTIGLFTRMNVPSFFPQPQTYATAAGENAVVTLQDGARVDLAPRTVMTTRGSDITVSGEAFFEITHRTAEPWLVHVGDATVRVLGTAFSVRHYADDRDVHVVVTEGRVGVVAPRLRSGVTVAAGRAMQLHDSTVSTQSADSRGSYTDWTTHQLVFQHASVSEVLAELGRWYGYQFRLADSTLATQHMSAAFDSRSITGTLALLKTTLDVTLTFDDTVVTLKRRHRDAGGARDTRYQVHDSFSTSREVGR